ncbi:hypothetical protein AB0O00_24600, partial [Kitasatospora sp. NPDC093558]
PTAPHLPALIDVGQGESALAELADAGLAVSIGGHHRLTAGALELLLPHWPARGSVDGAAQHFAWWVGHSSVSLGQIAAEAEVVIGVLLADRTAGRHEAVVRLARAAAPALALSLRWGAWERALQLGLEAARRTASKADEAWFHHELGVYAICAQESSQAIAELETALTLRAVAGEQRGVASARRMLDLLRAEGRQLPGAQPAAAAPARGPVIRKIAARVPSGLRSGRRRRVAVASAAVLTLGVLSTAVAMSVTGPGEQRTNDPHSRLDQDDTGSNGQVPLPHASTGAPSTAGADAPGGSPAASATSAEPSASGSATHSPSASASASASASKKPSRSPGATESDVPQQPQPSQPAPGDPQPPVQPPGPGPKPSQPPGPQPSQPPAPSSSPSASTPPTTTPPSSTPTTTPPSSTPTSTKSP